jgi:type IV secretory pathway component VirB8
MENQNIQDANEEPTSIFSEEDFSVDIYDKHIRQARNAIFVCAGILFVSLMILIFTIPEGYDGLWMDILFWSVLL